MGDTLGVVTQVLGNTIVPDMTADRSGSCSMFVEMANLATGYGVSEDLKKYFEDSDIQLQLVPPHTNRRNAAERAVRNFREHFIAAL